MRIDLEFVVTHVTQSSNLAEQGVKAVLIPSGDNSSGSTGFNYRAGEFFLQILDRKELAKFGPGRSFQVSFEG